MAAVAGRGVVMRLGLRSARRHRPVRLGAFDADDIENATGDRIKAPPNRRERIISGNFFERNERRYRGSASEDAWLPRCRLDGGSLRSYLHADIEFLRHQRGRQEDQTQDERFCKARHIVPPNC